LDPEWQEGQLVQLFVHGQVLVTRLVQVMASQSDSFHLGEPSNLAESALAESLRPEVAGCR
jgi:hypothetical protein